MKTKFFNVFVLLEQFRKDNKGAVAIIYGPMFIVLLLAAGLAIDYARAYLVKKEISRAIDASILAAGSMANADEDEMKVVAERYFEANLSDSTKANYDPQLNFDLNETTNEITASSNASVETYLMKLAGFATVDVGANAVAGRSIVNVEVALVLDNSGSMQGSKLSSLETASKKLVETLYEPEGSSSFVKFSLVPFTGTVNVGTAHLNADWIDGDGVSQASQEAFGSDFKYWEWKDGNSSTENQYRGMTAKEAFGFFDYDWNGCVRARVGTTTNDEGDTVGYDLWDVPADTSDPDSLFPFHVHTTHTKWQEVVTHSSQIPSNSQVRNQLKKNLHLLCPTEAITPLTNDQNTIETAIEDMVANGGTNITTGFMWGWRVLSSASPFTQGADYAPDVVKVIVVLTDGQNDVGSYNSNKTGNYFSAYGAPAFGNLGTQPRLADKLDEKLSVACSNAKSRGILVYSITFQLNDTNTQNLMRGCATQPDMYFNSPSNDALEDAFEKIASGLQKLLLKK